MPRKFDFVSPGVQITEVDQSQIETPLAEEDGLLVIGTAQTGPALKPIKIKSLDNFLDIFGKPISGKGTVNDDVWRDGNNQNPSYAMYAAQAWLASETTPLTFVRLLGEDHPSSTGVKAGWNLGGAVLSGQPNASVSAYGLFLVPSASATANPTGTLAAVFYTSGSAITLSGTIAERPSLTTSSAGTLIKSISSGQAATFQIDISDSTAQLPGASYAPAESLIVHLNPDEKTSYIRNVANTNPHKLFATNAPSAQVKKYFLGETYEEAVKRLVTDVSSSAGNQYGIILPLASGSAAANNLVNHLGAARISRSGYVINRNPSPKANKANFQADAMKKLFRFASLSEGSWFERNYYIVISDLQLGSVQNPNSSFSVSIRNKAGDAVEQFSNLNLDESSENFIGKRIGDMFQTWDTAKKRYELFGQYPNNSSYIRVEMAPDWEAGIDDAYMLPFGFFGPVHPQSFTVSYGSSGPQVLGDGVNTGTRSNRSITYGGAMSNNDDLIFTHPTDGVFTINFKNGSGAPPTTFSATNEATINLTTTDNAAKTAAAVSTLINSLTDYSASQDGSDVRITASLSGPHFNVLLSENAGAQQTIGALVAGTDTDNMVHPYVRGNKTMAYAGGDDDVFAILPQNYTASFSFPRLKLTEQNTSRNGINYNGKDLFGLNHKFATDNVRGVLNDRSYIDLLRFQGGGINLDTVSDGTQHSFVFSMDEIRESNGRFYWESGSAPGGNAFTSTQGTNALLTSSVRQFALPMFGGSDGVDITQISPFSSKTILDNYAETTHYANYSVQKAIESISDSEVVKFDVLAMPGLTNTALSNEIIATVEDRGDALAIIDLDDQYKETYENSGTRTGGGIDDVKATAVSRDLNTSYAATYYPRVRMRDTISGNGDVFIAPASVAALGALAFSDANSDGPWFAPAGFNRGGISILGGNEGPRVIGTWKNLPKADRDELYELNINPIARFPAVGETVIFGQKTLQQTPSALDRINVRRLMVFLKKKIGSIADTILFDQNVPATWSRFKSRADLILRDVQSRFGITEFKLVLDTTTTTPDLIDQNILYAKIFVKPARSIEFIAIDFIITRSGVQF